MSFSKVYSAQVNLLNGKIVTVEVDITEKTLYAFSIVGLPDKAVEEAKDRVSGAIKNSNFPSPKAKNQKIIVSLSPADLKKEGPFFDLAIALAYLKAKDLVSFDSEYKVFFGELGLDGTLRQIQGALPLTKEAKRLGFKEVYLPKENAKEASLIEGIKVFGVGNLLQVVNHLEGRSLIKPEEKTEINFNLKKTTRNFSEIRGQESAKRALEIAASGGHNLAMFGPPGTGKTMLARAFSEILPPLTEEEVLEVTGIHSIVGANQGELIVQPPFRSPHHTSSYVSIIGGGAYPKPGEVTLAHKGVLFLDEFPEFDKRVIESLRQPLEDNVVSISRAKGSAIFPSNFILITAMNPCPCGNSGSKKKECICKSSDIERYKRKLSGPIVDRIDLWVLVSDIDYKKLSSETNLVSEEEIKLKVKKARERQKNRFKGAGRDISTNSEMSVSDLSKLVLISGKIRDLLDESAEKLSLSPRAYHRIIKIAQTIADLDESDKIEEHHILEALQYRPKLNT